VTDKQNSLSLCDVNIAVDVKPYTPLTNLGVCAMAVSGQSVCHRQIRSCASFLTAEQIGDIRLG